MKTLTFEIAINAPRAVVWTNMLGAETYKVWTSPFCEGTYFVGSWDKGARIHFLAPSGDGMVAVIAENTPHEYVSIRHIGMIENGVEDTTSGCRVIVTLDAAAQYEQFMRDTYPKALARLKELCEQ